jgi:hypothetical protein
LATSASATIEYAFTSDYGAFTFTSPSFFERGNIPGPGGTVLSHSANLDEVRFGDSDVLLISPGCLANDSCFDATFLEDGIFQKLGDFVASNGHARIAISELTTPTAVPEPSTWALLALGFAGLGFMGSRRVSC